MRMATPTPELLKPGKWKKNDDRQGSVDLKNNIYNAPCDDSPESAAIRDHEYDHIMYSVPKQSIKEVARADQLVGLAIGSFEDYRVNYLGMQECGVDVSAAGNYDLDKNAESSGQVLTDRIPKMPPVMQGMFYVASMGYTDPHKYMPLLEKHLGPAKVTAIKGILQKVSDRADEDIAMNLHISRRPKENLESFKELLENVKEFVALFDPPSPQPKGSGGSGQPQSGQGKGQGQPNPSPDPPDPKKGKDPQHKGGGTKPPEIEEVKGPGRDEDKDPKPQKIPDPDPATYAARNNTASQVIQTMKSLAGDSNSFTSGMQGDDDESVSLNTLRKIRINKNNSSKAPWGEVRIVNSKGMKPAQRFEGVRLRPRKKANQFGATFRYVNRLLTDKAIFATPKKDNLGTILIDVSGSMSIDFDDILTILKFSGTATIAWYCGRQTDGELVILAQHGKVVSKLPHTYGGNNIVDKPSLDWLAKQPAPRWWVSDGLVTGIYGRCSEACGNACRKIKNRAQIKQVKSPQEFIQLIKKNQLRQYKDKCEIATNW